ncbi:MAG: hypothetical protein J6V07_00045 [Clostridia bacterium]|nr:hypothetical protein [Clostridia bacterium]
METKKIIEGFRNWLKTQEIEGVEINEDVGRDGDVTTITFPVAEEEGYISYDIIASMIDGGALYFYIEYCDLPEADELELYRFINDLNKLSALTVTAEEGRLCFGYTIPLDYIDDPLLFSRAFFDIWDWVDELRDDIHEAFGLWEYATQSDDVEDLDDTDTEEYDEEE